ncbi:MAG: hypothetical protein AB1568_06345 [Thermodesulfobacteriota bacterium]
MTNLIQDRPTELDSIDNYTLLPPLPVSIDLSASLHDFLNFDIHDLDGVQPIETKYIKDEPGFIEVNPSEAQLDKYEKDNVKFQMISVIVNAFGFKEVNGVMVGKPYSVSLKPMKKMGKISTVTPSFLRQLKLDELKENDWVYMGFNPFQQSYQMYGQYSTFISGSQYKMHPDMIGFVFNTYALSTKWEYDNICLPELKNSNEFLSAKYRKFRIRRYFKIFENLTPRKIWGCDSPIELFLLHALEKEDLNPEIQTALFENGETYPSLHHMISDNRRESEIRQITDADFYFPEKKFAIFCDSRSHHRSLKAKQKDERIDSELLNLGIRSLRISGSEIVNNPFNCVNLIKENL